MVVAVVVPVESVAVVVCVPSVAFVERVENIETLNQTISKLLISCHICAMM